MTNPFYPYSALPDRPPLTLPDGKRIAVWVGLNIEHYEYGKPALSLAQFTAGLTPDPLNHAWREYGPRVGIWRMIEMFDRLGIQPTAILNSDVVGEHPAIIRAGVERGWAWVAHGRNNTTWQAGMARDVERAYIDDVASVIEKATGARPAGWLGPALTATAATNDLLAELGFRYCLDWAADDEPFPFTVAKGSLLSVPYSAELNDIPFYALQGQPASAFRQALIDQFDQLYAEGGESARVMAISVHPYITGVPHRIAYLEKLYEYIRQRPGVLFWTGEQILDWYRPLARR
jgi:allantoinase